VEPAGFEAVPHRVGLEQRGLRIDGRRSGFRSIPSWRAMPVARTCTSSPEQTDADYAA
jgi:hypothetical protein